MSRSSQPDVTPTAFARDTSLEKGGESMRQSKVLASLLGAVCLLVVVATAAASVFNVAPLTLVSGPSPFANCTIGGPGTVYVNAEVEPWVAVNPSNPNNIVAVFQQDRWSNGGAHGLVTATSQDGGQTWSQTFAHFSSCSGGTAA